MRASHRLRCVDAFGEKLRSVLVGPGRAPGACTRSRRGVSRPSGAGPRSTRRSGSSVAVVQVLAGTADEAPRGRPPDRRCARALGSCAGLRRSMSSTPNAAGTTLAGDSHSEGRRRSASRRDRSRHDDRSRRGPSRFATDPVGSTLWIDRRHACVYPSDGTMRIYDASLATQGSHLGLDRRRRRRDRSQDCVRRHARRTLCPAELPSSKVRVVRRLPGTPECHRLASALAMPEGVRARE